MRVQVYVTDAPWPEGAVDPIAFVRDDATAELPRHPSGYTWRYFASTDTSDALLLQLRRRIEDSIEEAGAYVATETFEELRWELAVKRAS